MFSVTAIEPVCRLDFGSWSDREVHAIGARGDANVRTVSVAPSEGCVRFTSTVPSSKFCMAWKLKFFQVTGSVKRATPSNIRPGNARRPRNGSPEVWLAPVMAQYDWSCKINLGFRKWCAAGGAMCIRARMHTYLRCVDSWELHLWNRRNPANCTKYSIGFRCMKAIRGLFEVAKGSSIAHIIQKANKIAPADANTNVSISNNGAIANVVMVTAAVSGVRWEGFRVGLRMLKFINAGGISVLTAERSGWILLSSRKRSVHA